MKLAVIFTAVIVLCGNLIPACCFPQTNFWKQTNGPLGGYVYNMAQMPTGEIIVSTMTGLFLSADGGYTWETIYFGENRFHSLAISGNMLFGADLQNGAFRSTDMGRSWAHVGTYYNSNVFSTRSGLVFVSDLFPGKPSSKVWRSST
jgi:photosystem II stability/assembly factor-like uncharacterized protein